jgi:hypothetical protein
MSDKKRQRLTRKQLSKLSGRGKGFGKPHCAEHDGNNGIVYRLYAPGPNARNDYLIKVLRTDTEEALADPKLAQWVTAKTFGFAVLLETEGRLQTVQRLLARHAPWPISIQLELVPALGQLAQHIRAGSSEEQIDKNALPRAEA